MRGLYAQGGQLLTMSLSCQDVLRGQLGHEQRVVRPASIGPEHGLEGLLHVGLMQGVRVLPACKTTFRPVFRPGRQLARRHCICDLWVWACASRPCHWLGPVLLPTA